MLTTTILDVKPVVSENVVAYDYDPTSQILHVEFHSGGLYEYSNVPQSIAAEFELPHPWRRVNKTLKAYPYRKLR